MSLTCNTNRVGCHVAAAAAAPDADACCYSQEGERYDLEFEWTSPLSGRAGRFFRLNGLRNEQGMVSWGLGSRALPASRQSCQSAGGEGPSYACTEIQPMDQ